MQLQALDPSGNIQAVFLNDFVEKGSVALDSTAASLNIVRSGTDLKIHFGREPVFANVLTPAEGQTQSMPTK